jgi:hypothetical protein
MMPLGVAIKPGPCLCLVCSQSGRAGAGLGSAVFEIFVKWGGDVIERGYLCGFHLRDIKDRGYVVRQIAGGGL